MPLIVSATGVLTGTSVGANNAIPINGGTGVRVRPGDLVVSLLAQQTALTSSGCVDNLGNTYTAQNAGTLSNTISGRMWYARVTVAGVITSVTMSATASANDFSACAAIFSNGFDSPPIDVNLANTTGDTATPYPAPATGTLAQLNELVVAWSANNANATWAATVVTTAIQVSQANSHAVISYLDAVTSSSITPSFSGTAPTSNVLGTASFKQTVPLGQAML